MNTDYLQELNTENKKYWICNYPARLRDLNIKLSELPFSLRVLSENLLRFEGDAAQAALLALASRSKDFDLTFRPARVLLQDLLGTPALVDLAGLRDAVSKQGGDPRQVNPKRPTHLIVDHSINVNFWGTNHALADNSAVEQEKNKERFSFLEWCDKAFSNLDVLPSGQGIVHQINLEKLTPVVFVEPFNDGWLAYPDTLVGTDSHTTMINAIGVLGWGVGGIEAEAAMLGRALTMRLPDIIGVRLEGSLPTGYTATDVVLTLTEKLRNAGVIGAFIEFFGPGADQLSLADRATISNMAPEFGATAALFPLDRRSIDYLKTTGRNKETCILTEKYAQQQGLWAGDFENAHYDHVYTFDLSQVKKTIAGPLQPHQRIVLGEQEMLGEKLKTTRPSPDKLRDGDVVLAAITSCTNTSNPRSVITAALLARNARAHGLTRSPWVKTSFSPGSRVVTDYLAEAGLDKDLDALGFNVVGYGCMTCNGMSGPLISREIEEYIRKEGVQVAAVTSGNRNFAGRVHPLAREVYIMSPPLIIAYAIAGTTRFDPETDPLGKDPHGRDCYLRDLWPSEEEINCVESKFLHAELFDKAYRNLTRQADSASADTNNKPLYDWKPDSTYIRIPPYWTEEFGAPDPNKDLSGMRVLAMIGDNITTDHISPSGAILADSDTGRYLLERGIGEDHFNSYGTRRGNHEAAQRATFANPRLINELCLDGREGSYTRLLPDNTYTTIFTAAMAYRARRQPLLVIAGKSYGSGSSRDWAAKGPRLLGVRAVLAESFERIHRSNLVGMGILPLQFSPGQNRRSLNLSGEEIFSIRAVDGPLRPGQELTVEIQRSKNHVENIQVRCCLETEEDITYYRNGGLLTTLIREYIQ